MYLYLGQSTVVPKSSVVAVCDMDNTTQSKHTIITGCMGRLIKI